jgi:hypothetical protein
MTTDRSTEYLTGLMRELCKLPRETQLWGRSFSECIATGWAGSRQGNRDTP